jgi:hypothetical protein
MDTPEQQITQIIDDFLIQLITTEVDWDFKPMADKWSKKEIIGHLIDSATNNLSRFVRCTYEQNFKLVYAQNEWVAAQHYQDAKIEDLLIIWRLLNRQISRVLKNYPAQAWQNTCDNDEIRTVEQLVKDYVAHLSHHLEQIIS